MGIAENVIPIRSYRAEVFRLLNKSRCGCLLLFEDTQIRAH